MTPGTWISSTAYFLFNLAALTYVVIGLATTNALPQIPNLLLALTSASAATYAANKSVGQNTPCITALTPMSVAPGQRLTIDGFNFLPSPRPRRPRSPSGMLRPWSRRVHRWQAGCDRPRRSHAGYHLGGRDAGGRRRLRPPDDHGGGRRREHRLHLAATRRARCRHRDRRAGLLLRPRLRVDRHRHVPGRVTRPGIDHPAGQRSRPDRHADSTRRCAGLPHHGERPHRSRHPDTGGVLHMVGH